MLLFRLNFFSHFLFCFFFSVIAENERLRQRILFWQRASSYIAFYINVIICVIYAILLHQARSNIVQTNVNFRFHFVFLSFYGFQRNARNYHIICASRVCWCVSVHRSKHSGYLLANNSQYKESNQAEKICQRSNSNYGNGSTKTSSQAI